MNCRPTKYFAYTRHASMYGLKNLKLMGISGQRPRGFDKSPYKIWPLQHHQSLTKNKNVLKILYLFTYGHITSYAHVLLITERTQLKLLWLSPIVVNIVVSSYQIVTIVLQRRQLPLLIIKTYFLRRIGWIQRPRMLLQTRTSRSSRGYPAPLNICTNIH